MNNLKRKYPQMGTYGYTYKSASYQRMLRRRLKELAETQLQKELDRQLTITTGGENGEHR